MTFRQKPNQWPYYKTIFLGKINQAFGQNCQKKFICCIQTKPYIRKEKIIICTQKEKEKSTNRKHRIPNKTPKKHYDKCWSSQLLIAYSFLPCTHNAEENLTLDLTGFKQDKVTKFWPNVNPCKLTHIYAGILGAWGNISKRGC